MRPDDLGWRRRLARELTRRAALGPREAMMLDIDMAGAARRVGITGPPGAGKSSLIACLARHWLDAGERVGVLAVDPSSPVSGGALLGDRIRMDEAGESLEMFIRSQSSGRAADGLCPNVLPLLDAFEHAGFDRLVLETVGVGQVSFEARALVETFVLVLIPESGDTVQAMKAGVLEVADVFVVNKCDLPAAEKLAAELRTMAEWRGRQTGWAPPVILTSTTRGTGVAELVSAVNAHRATCLDATRLDELRALRRDYHVRSTITGEVERIMSKAHDLSSSAHMPAVFQHVIRQLEETVAG